MVQQDQDRVLEGTERVEGRTALRDNVAAAIALADAVRSTRGNSPPADPKGLRRWGHADPQGTGAGVPHSIDVDPV